MLILIVDDYPACRRLMRDVLEAPDIAFVEAADGEEAVEAFEAHQPDWVVMDIDMPRMDGIAATLAIRQANPKARIIVATAHDSVAFRQAADQAGATAFVAKEEFHRLREMFRDLAASPAEAPRTEGNLSGQVRPRKQPANHQDTANAKPAQMNTQRLR